MADEPRPTERASGFFSTGTRRGMTRREWSGRLLLSGLVVGGVIYGLFGGGLPGYLFAACWFLALLFVYEPWILYAKRKRKGYYSLLDDG
jgi:hypothetical protein